MGYQTATKRVTGANTATSPTGSNVFTVLDATERCYINDIEFQGLGDNLATAANVWKNGSLLRKVSLPVASAYDGTSGIDSVSVSLAKYLDVGDKIHVTVETFTGAGWDVNLEVAPHYSDFNV